MTHFTKAQANEVFDILYEHGGASEGLREQFVHYLTHRVGGGGHEFRFSGHLGWGGKLYYSPRSYGASLYTAFYSEDYTEQRDEICQDLNKRLAEWYAEELPHLPSPADNS